MRKSRKSVLSLENCLLLGALRSGKNSFIMLGIRNDSIETPYRIRHFDRKRTYEQFKKRMEKGFDPIKQEEQKQ